MKILVFCEQRNGQLKNSSLEILSVAADLSGGNPQSVTAVLMGKGVSALVPSLKGFGAESTVTIEHDDLTLYNPQHYAQALSQAISAEKPDLVLGSASAMGRDLFPRVAAKLDAGLITDVVHVDCQNGICLGGTKPMYAGKVLASVQFQNTSLKMMTLRPNVFSKNQTQGAATPKALAFDPQANVAMKTLEIVAGKSAKTDLTEASRIITGGRAMGAAEKFSILHECAEALGASVGASRAAVDAGYATHDMQVGQTGKTVNPNLYIACGVSGAIQHMAGMRTSKVIVAINSDPEAPIHQVADYGIVADLFEAVPILTKKFKAMLQG